MDKREEYLEKMFTEKGFSTLHVYLKNLVKEYFTQKSYPFSIGIIFGIPFFKDESWDREFKNKDELLGRIKQLMQILWVNGVEVKVGNSIKILEFGKGDEQ